MLANTCLLLTAVWGLNNGAQRSSKFLNKKLKLKNTTKKKRPVVINIVTPENVLADPVRSAVQLFAFYLFVKLNKAIGYELRTFIAQCLHFLTHAVFSLYKPWFTLIDEEVDHWQAAANQSIISVVDATKGTLMRSTDGTYVSLLPMTVYCLLCLPGLAYSLRDPIDRLIRRYHPTLFCKCNYRLGALTVRNYFFERSRRRNLRLIVRFKVNTKKLICKLLALFIICLHLNKRHWITNNIIGLSQTVNTIESVCLTNFKTGFTLLVCYSLFDIFWVYLTDIMVTVAGGVDAPLKLVFSNDSLLNLSWFYSSPRSYKTLGLGDIIIPGYFASLALRYAESVDQYEYYYAVLVGYTVGMCAALVIGDRCGIIQPMLLYTICGCSLCLLAVAFWKNKLKLMMNYNEC